MNRLLPLSLLILAALSRPGSSQAVWTRQNSGTPDALHLVIWTGNQLVAASRFTFDMLTSPDGVTWTRQEPGNTGGAGAGWNGLAWTGPGAGQVVALSWADKRIMTSPDGVTWTTRVVSDTDDHYLSSAAWTGTQIVAVGIGEMTSPDGVAWTSRPGPEKPLNSVVWTGNKLVAVGADGAILTSPDGVTWTNRPSGVQGDLRCIIAAGSQLVAVGARGIILTSPDGVTWTARTSGTNDDINSLVWTGSQLVAVGGDPSQAANNVILTSQDGATWTSRSLGTTDMLENIAWTGSRLVVVGQFGMILTSPQDGAAITKSSPQKLYLRMKRLGLSVGLPTGFPIQDGFHVTVYTLSGEQKLRIEKKSAPNGKFVIPMTGIPSGKYLLEISAPRVRLSQAFTKK